MNYGKTIFLNVNLIEDKMILFKHCISTLAIATALVCASGAQASTIQMNNFVYSSAQSVHISTGYTGGAGGFNAVFDGNQSFIAYCIDTAQSFSWGSAFTVTSTTASAQFGTSKALAMGQLYTQHFASISNTKQSAAFQLSLWEIVNETGSNYSLTNGSFTATSTDASIASMANSWLSGLSGAGNAYTLTAYVSPTKQDQLRATLAPVPVPGAAWLLGSGLIGLAGIMHRRDSIKTL